ncbi:MAG TPA: NAD(P)H-hydrate dehydratase [Abditibacteriaceae bacterium]|jgi:NAD(P)H-hydrate epimerase
MKIFSPEQMRALDKVASEQFHIPSIVLMENAALRVVEFLEQQFAPLSSKKILVLCGKGNNGGDGFAIARHLQGGAQVTVFMTSAPGDLKGDALINFKILRAGGAAVAHAGTRSGALRWDSFDIIVDALLGTGFSGEIRGEELKHTLEMAALAPAPIVAVDVPSGLNADTGEAAAEALKADYTVTLAAPKRGLFLGRGLDLCGEIWVGSIGTPERLMEASETGVQAVTRRTAQDFAAQLKRPLDAHKGDAGRVLILGGSFGMSGAPTMSAHAALRAGTGLVTAALPNRVVPIFAASQNEAMSRPLLDDAQGRLVEASFDDVPRLWENMDAVALGPGLSRGAGALDFARRVIEKCPAPLIIDADALYALRAITKQTKERTAPTILTPHPGEMGELMQMEISDVQKARFDTARQCAEKYKAFVVLKGARSVIATPEGQLFVNLTGNPGMATGGSGDVLTGLIAGLLAQLKDAQSATLLGVYAHGLAGDLAYSSNGNGLIAGDIILELPHALMALQKPMAPTGNRLQRLT